MAASGTQAHTHRLRPVGLSPRGHGGPTSHDPRPKTQAGAVHGSQGKPESLEVWNPWPWCAAHPRRHGQSCAAEASPRAEAQRQSRHGDTLHLEACLMALVPRPRPSTPWETRMRPEIARELIPLAPSLARKPSPQHVFRRRFEPRNGSRLRFPFAHEHKRRISGAGLTTVCAPCPRNVVTTPQCCKLQATRAASSTSESPRPCHQHSHWRELVAHRRDSTGSTTATTTTTTIDANTTTTTNPGAFASCTLQPPPPQHPRHGSFRPLADDCSCFRRARSATRPARPAQAATSRRCSLCALPQREGQGM
jgi:hypothetical protein